jgi:uroporphyrinogen-III synthase
MDQNTGMTEPSAIVRDELPLGGRNVVVTRSREQASSLSQQLRALGATVIEIPTIAILPPASFEPLDQALREFATYDCLIVTSANTARVIGERRAALSLDLARQPRTVAVGPATAAALEAIGLRVDLVPQPSIAESVVAALKDQVKDQRVLLARAEVARDVLPLALQKAGAHVSVVDAYRTVLAEDSAALVAEVFSEGAQLDALTFTSSSTVKNLHALLELAGASWPTRAKIFSIGPITSATLREFGRVPDYEAAQHDIPGLLKLLLAGFPNA